MDSFTNLGENKPLNKNVGRVNLNQVDDVDSDLEVARQIGEVSPPGSSSSTPVKDE